MSRILSAAQPSGRLHIGNWLGAIKNWVDAQHQHESIFCIVDLHSITVEQKPEELRAAIRDLAAWYIACGIDPNVASIVVQSDVPAHAELSWILTCMTPIGWLERMTQYKSKSEGKSVDAGLLCYPVLMAADILLYQADIVPVGADQAQHLELCRDIANRFNARYGQTFVMPSTQLGKAGSRVMGLDDPTVKMSKSATGPLHAVFLGDPPDVVMKKLKRAVTDSGTEVRFDETKPGVTNLLTIYQVLSGLPPAEVEAHFSGKLYGALKVETGELIVEKLRPLQQRHREVLAEAGYLENLLRSGAEKVRPLAGKTLQLVKDRVGLGLGGAR
jgi:tryptophanyl-tRNA synthetase